MPKMMQNRMCAPGKSRRGIGGVLRELFTYSSKLKAPSVAAFCFAVAGAVLTIIGPSLPSDHGPHLRRPGRGDRSGRHRPHRRNPAGDLRLQCRLYL